MLTVLCLVFFVLAALGMPIAFALGLSSLVAMLYAGFDPIQIAGKMVHAVDSFPLMAIPLFMLAGQLMIPGRYHGPAYRFRQRRDGAGSRRTRPCHDRVRHGLFLGIGRCRC